MTRNGALLRVDLLATTALFTSIQRPNRQTSLGLFSRKDVFS